MKKLFFLMMIALVASSCSRLVSADYEMLDNGVVTSIDTVKQTVSICSMNDSVCRKWYAPAVGVDYLSQYGAEYADKYGVGDSVYVYLDGSDVLISKRSITDAKNINDAISSYYWDNLLDNWIVLSIVVIVAFVLVVIIFGVRDIDAIWYFLGIVCVFGCLIVALDVSGMGKDLSYEAEGSVTRIEGNRLELNGYLVVPMASLEDITTKNTVKEGQDVYLYQYGRQKTFGSKMFASSKKLNEEVLSATQTYPEIWLYVICAFAVLIIIAFVINSMCSRYKKRRYDTD